MEKQQTPRQIMLQSSREWEWKKKKKKRTEQGDDEAC